MTDDWTLSNVEQDRITAIELFQTMLKVRLTELKIAEIYPTDKIQSPIHLCIGQEAVCAGVCKALRQEDHLYGTYRSHGIFISKGGDLKRMFSELYGKETGCARGKGGSMHLAAPEVGLMGCSALVGSVIPVATGDALAAQMQGQNRVAAAFFGDGAVDEGVFFESINFAVLKKLPIIYVCENNNYAVHSKIEERHKVTELFNIGMGLGLAGSRFDGNEAAEVYSSMSMAVDRARKGEGPFFIEYRTYRWYEHVGPGMDHSAAYRDQQKLKEALENDPLKRAEDILKKRYHVPEHQFREWERFIQQEIEQAVEFAEKSPYPAPSQLYEDLFA